MIVTSFQREKNKVVFEVECNTDERLALLKKILALPDEKPPKKEKMTLKNYVQRQRRAFSEDDV